MGSLERQIRAFIDRESLLPHGEAVLVGVSGGLDSRVLLGVLHRLAASRRLRLVVAHFNHRLRGAAAEADQRFVQALARRLGLEYVGAAGDVRRLAKAEGWSLEMAARQLRHQFLAAAARERDIRTVALGHQAEDQVELFWLRLLRGASPAGLAGMSPQSVSPVDPHVRIIRPLLECRRPSLEAWARSERWRWREDTSNRSLDILRNRVRHRLIPRLAREYQPTLTQSILRLMDMLRADAAALTALDPAGEAGSETGCGPGQLPVSLRRRRLVRQLARAGVAPEFELVERLRQSPGTPQTVRGGRRVAESPEGVLREVPVVAGPAAGPALSVALRGRPGAVEFGGTQVSWTLRRRPRSAVPPPRQRPGEEHFDAASVGDHVRLRHWQAGDRFQPIGMHRPVKLQDLFVNRKVPALERRRRLVAEDASGRVFWVQGERISHLHRLTDRTRRVLVWRFRPATERAPDESSA